MSSSKYSQSAQSLQKTAAAASSFRSAHVIQFDLEEHLNSGAFDAPGAAPEPRENSEFLGIYRTTPENKDVSSIGSTTYAPEKEIKSASKSGPNLDFRLNHIARHLAHRHYMETGESVAKTVQACGVLKGFGSEYPDEAEIRVTDGRAKLHGHALCKSSWSCPHCARLKGLRILNWMKNKAMPIIQVCEYVCVMETFTISHQMEGDWGATVKLLTQAYKKLENLRMGDKVGMLATLKALEAPVGKNGLHPHFHCLVVFPKGTKYKALNAYGDKRSAAWQKVVASLGGTANARGYDMSFDCSADYILKLQTCFELASPDTKDHAGTEIEHGKTTNQLLVAADRGRRLAIAGKHDAARAGAAAGDNWIRAMVALKGSKRFAVGKLPKLLCIEGPDADKEEEIEIDINKPEPKIVDIRYPMTEHRKACRSYRAFQPMVLNRAERGGEPAVLGLVSSVCAEVDAQEVITAIKVRVFSVPLAEMHAAVEAAKKRILTPSEVDAYTAAMRRLPELFKS